MNKKKLIEMVKRQLQENHNITLVNPEMDAVLAAVEVALKSNKIDSRTKTILSKIKDKFHVMY
jgi:hypothetical protein